MNGNVKIGEKFTEKIKPFFYVYWKTKQKKESRKYIQMLCKKK